MPTAKDRLKRFLALADQGPAQRAALAKELIDFLVCWPEECPRAMRRPVLTLLAMTLEEADEGIRGRLAARLGDIDDLPLAAANKMFFYAPRAVQHVILRRNETANDLPHPIPVRDPLRLLADARGENNVHFPLLFSRAVHIPPDCAADILADGGGQSLATVCKGTGVNRGLYSALAVLIFRKMPADPTRLTAYEEIPRKAAENITAYWQSWNAPSSRAA